MRIGLIGAGRVANHLGKILAQSHDIVEVHSRTLHSAKDLAMKLQARVCDEITALDCAVDLIIIAVQDQQIASIAEALGKLNPQALVVHTSGSTHIEILRDVGLRAGVFYPLQTFSMDREIDWQETPIFVEADIQEDQQKLSALAQSLSQRTYLYSSAQRLTLHMAAVFACNFSNYCYDMAKQIVDAQQVDFSLLYPLMLETAQKALKYDPVAMQTGPAMRGDQNVLNMHEQLLDQSQRQDLAEVYTLLSQQIMQRHGS